MFNYSSTKGRVIPYTDSAFEVQQQNRLLDVARGLLIDTKIETAINPMLDREIMLNGEPMDTDLQSYIRKYSVGFMFLYVVLGIVPARVMTFDGQNDEPSKSKLGTLVKPANFSLGAIALEELNEDIHPIWKSDNTVIEQTHAKHVIYEGAYPPTIRVEEYNMYRTPEEEETAHNSRIKFISPILPILHKQIRYEAIQKWGLTASRVSYESRYHMHSILPPLKPEEHHNFMLYKASNAARSLDNTSTNAHNQYTAEQRRVHYVNNFEHPNEKWRRFMQRVRTEGKTNVNRGMYRGSAFVSGELTEPHAIPERRLEAEFYKEFKAEIEGDLRDFFGRRNNFSSSNVGKSNYTLQNFIYDSRVANWAKVLGNIWTFFLNSVGKEGSSYTVTFTHKSVSQNDWLKDLLVIFANKPRFEDRIMRFIVQNVDEEDTDALEHHEGDYEEEVVAAAPAPAKKVVKKNTKKDKKKEGNAQVKNARGSEEEPIRKEVESLIDQLATRDTKYAKFIRGKNFLDQLKKLVGNEDYHMKFMSLVIDLLAKK